MSDTGARPTLLPELLPPAGRGEDTPEHAALSAYLDHTKPCAECSTRLWNCAAGKELWAAYKALCTPPDSRRDTAPGTRMSADDQRPPICGEEVKLPTRLIVRAITLGQAIDTTSIARHLTCTQQEHPDQEPHHCLVMGIEGTVGDSTVGNGVWTSWADGRAPQTLELRPDCPGGDDGHGCASFAGHPGLHSPQLLDELRDKARTVPDLLGPGSVLPGT